MYTSTVRVRTMIACLTALVVTLPVFGQDQSEQQSEKPTEGKDWTVPGLDMEMVYVKPGTFKMGSNNQEAAEDEQPVHKVKISKGF